jgi:hypothetical protein
MEQKTTRRHRGKGRKPAREERLYIRVTAAEKAQYLALGGSKAFRRWLKETTTDCSR